jgi:hypothetical protein
MPSARAFLNMGDASNRLDRRLPFGRRILRIFLMPVLLPLGNAISNMETYYPSLRQWFMRRG